MRLPSLFRRFPSGRASDRAPADAPLSPDETVASLRTRARRRLIGATVLVAVAVVSLPWLFESQPRPLPPDLAVELAGKDAPPPSADNRGNDRAPAAVQVPPAADTAPPAIPRPASSPDPRPPSGPGPDRAAARSDDTPAPDAATTPRAVHPSASPPPSTARLPDAARARALLDGTGTAAVPSPLPTGVRYIVQLGAYAEADAVTAARGKAEHLGLKTYTQVIDAPAGRRTRVRVGPYASKGEADHAVSQLKSAGLAAVVLTLGGE